MLFTQLGLRAPDDRVTGNFGLGVRTFYTENWMFGANVFLTMISLVITGGLVWEVRHGPIT